MQGKESEDGKNTGGERDRGELTVGCRVVAELVLLSPCQVQADERDQENIGIDFTVECETDKGKKRRGEAQHQHGCANRERAQLAREAGRNGGKRSDGGHELKDKARKLQRFETP